MSSHNPQAQRLAETCARVAETARAGITSEIMRTAIADPAAAILSSSGKVIACSDLRHLGALGGAARVFLSQTHLSLDQDAVIVFNDPFSGGTRLHDFYAFRRAAEGDAFVVVKASNIDIGGEYFGNYHPNAVEIWAEGARITPTILSLSGKPVRDALTCVVLNSRAPRLLESLLNSIVNATIEADRLLADEVKQSGSIQAAADDLLGDGEQAARDALGALQVVQTRAEASLVFDKADLARVRLSVRKTTDVLDLDFTQSDKQIAGYHNVTRSMAFSVVLSQLFGGDTSIPVNDGLLRPIRIETANGTVMDAAYPAATGFGLVTAGTAVAQTLAQAFNTENRWRHPAATLLNANGRLSTELAQQVLEDERRLEPFLLPNTEF